MVRIRELLEIPEEELIEMSKESSLPYIWMQINQPDHKVIINGHLTYEQLGIMKEALDFYIKEKYGKVH